MKSIRCVLVLYLATCLVCSASGQSDAPSCPFDADEVRSLDLNQIKDACDPLSSSPSGDVCDACTASIVRTFKSLIPKFNVPCDAASTATQYTETALIVLLTTCPNQIFSTLEGAGFSIQKLANLESCPDGPYAQQIDAAKEICPNLPAGNQENGLRK
ncbi:hypothetical protein Ndes2437B_g01422 [Nannochloris sp. 'desiccata']